MIVYMRLNGQLFRHHLLPKYMYAIFCRDVSLNLEMYLVKLRNKKIKRKNVSFLIEWNINVSLQVINITDL